MISVVIPTITGRETWYQKCVAAYAATTTVPYEIIRVLDRPTCGIAWNKGAEVAALADWVFRFKGRPMHEYLHFTADDIEPHEGWAEAAVRCVETGSIPSARILSTNGTLQSCGVWGQEMDEGTVTDIVRVPFMSREQWHRIGPSLNTHYWTDNFLALRALAANIPVVVARDYLFTHHYAPEGRLDGPDGCFEADKAVFERALARS